jgi:serine/threonine protein kinase
VVLLQLAAALMYLHENNIIYRYTKPQNVGFDVRGDLKLFDFGLAKLLPSNDNYQDTYKLSMAGTPR